MMNTTQTPPGSYELNWYAQWSRSVAWHHQRSVEWRDRAPNMMPMIGHPPGEGCLDKSAYHQREAAAAALHACWWAHAYDAAVRRSTILN